MEINVSLIAYLIYLLSVGLEAFNPLFFPADFLLSKFLSPVQIDL